MPNRNPILILNSTTYHYRQPFVALLSSGSWRSWWSVEASRTVHSGESYRPALSLLSLFSRCSFVARNPWKSLTSRRPDRPPISLLSRKSVQPLRTHRTGVSPRTLRSGRPWSALSSTWRTRRTSQTLRSRFSVASGFSFRSDSTRKSGDAVGTAVTLLAWWTWRTCETVSALKREILLGFRGWVWLSGLP